MKMLSPGRRGRATNRVISSGGANFVSVSRGDALYSKSPPSTRRARLSISVLTVPSSLTFVTIPPGWAALGIWKPIMWNCSPNRFSLGGRVWQALHRRSYCRAKAGTASTGLGLAKATSPATSAGRPTATRTNRASRLSMPLPPHHREPGRMPRHTRTGAGQRPKAIRVVREGLDQQRGVQQEERRGARRRRRRRWVRTLGREVANDRQNDAGREEGRRIDIRVGTKSLAGTAVSG